MLVMLTVCLHGQDGTSFVSFHFTTM